MLGDGKVMVICAGNRMLLGQVAVRSGEENASTGNYTWREVTVPGEVVSFDARIRAEASSNQSLSVDVVLGLDTGAILVYDNVLTHLVKAEKGQIQSEALSRRLHWHRDAVQTVKWSRDGTWSVPATVIFH